MCHDSKLTFLRMAEYCGTPQSKERRNREYEACLNERALRLLDALSQENGAIFIVFYFFAPCLRRNSIDYFYQPAPSQVPYYVFHPS